MPAAGKPHKALGKKTPFNKEHLPNGLDSKPKEINKKSQCCKSKCRSHFLCALLHALARCRHHGQMSAAPERSPERPGDGHRDGTARPGLLLLLHHSSARRQEKKQMLGGYNDSIRARPRNEPALPALVQQSPRSISRMAAGWFGHGNDASCRKRLGPRDPARGQVLPLRTKLPEAPTQHHPSSYQ